MENALDFFQSLEEDDFENNKPTDNVIKFTQERIQNASEIIQQNYELYDYFCEKVLRKLLLEKYITFSD